MLRTRVITALVLLPLVLAAIYLFPPAAFAFFFWLIVAAAAWEWAGLAGLVHPLLRMTYVGGLGLICLLVGGEPATHLPLLALAVLAWGAAIVTVMRYPAGAGWLSRLVIGLGGWLLLVAAWVALLVIRLQPSGANWLLWLFLLVWAVDIGGYFAGRRFGRHKLAPGVSPGKTWEGVLGGVMLAGCVTIIPLLMVGLWTAAWLLLIGALVVISIFGDLFESVLKRQTGMKDSGSLLPGHGGVLDRVDSLLAVLPFFALLMGGLQGLPAV